MTRVTRARILAVILVSCAAFLAPATVPAARSGHIVLAVTIGVVAVACVALAARVLWPLLVKGGD